MLHESNFFVTTVFVTILIYIKGTVSDEKNIQITLEIKKNTYQSQYVPFISKKLPNFDRKIAFHIKISFHGH